MAHLITSMNLGRSSVTAGERRFGSRLQSLLEDDAMCWYDVPVGNRRRYPDFVVFSPTKGLLLLEVKDWKIHQLRSIDKSSVEVAFDDGLKTLTNPLEQARQCTMELVNQLQKDTELCKTEGRYHGKLLFPYGWGVVFPFITRKQLDDALSLEDQEQILPPHQVICSDEMTETMDAEVFRERLWGMFQYCFEQSLAPTQIDRVRWHLFPEVRINAIQGELFENEPLPDLIAVLDLQQEQLARNLGPGHRVIHGVAGSGKTLILGYRVAQLSEVLTKPILVICFNVSLASRLRQMIRERGLSEKVVVHHFHEWCGLQLRAHNLTPPAGDLPIWERQVQGVIDGVEQGFIPPGQYGAVIIDEGHDFQAAWLELAVRMVDPASGFFLLLYDDAQSIYQRSKQLGFSLSSVGIKAAGRTTILRINYRNTREILKFAYDFARESLGVQSADEDHIPLIEPRSAGIAGPVPQFRRMDDFNAELDHCIARIRQWIDQKVPLQEIAVIYLDYPQGGLISRRLVQEELDHLWMINRERKKQYDLTAPRITVLTVPSSKGLEFQCVIVMGVGSLPQQSEELSHQIRLLYVAMTRAKRELVITASADHPVVERFSRLVEACHAVNLP